MKLTPEELQQARNQLCAMKQRQIAAARINDPDLSKDDRILMQKYPRHTLEAARYIDASSGGGTSVGKGAEDSFWKLRMQETHGLKPDYHP
jgi:hypothetical protein